MTWHLKDRQLEQKLIAIDSEFREKLNKECERLDSNNDKDLFIYNQVILSLIHNSNLLGKIHFCGEDVEYIPEYDPQNWNKYPEVTPPENVLMRVECDGNMHTALIYKANRWQFESGENFQGLEKIYKVRRFRPWED